MPERRKWPRRESLKRPGGYDHSDSPCPRGLSKREFIKLAALVAVPLCFGLSSLIRKLPYADRVL